MARSKAKGAVRRSGCGRERCATWHNKPCLVCTHPDLLKEWDYERNERDPSGMSAGSEYKAHWICSQGHLRQAIVRNRTRFGSGCRACLGWVATSESNLSITHPDLVKEWDHERNEKQPTEVTFGSEYKAHWICSQGGHQWQTRVADRTGKQSGCPSCSGRRACLDNNLAFTHPDLVKEWDFKRNEKQPSEVTPSAHHKAHWICSKGHHWQVKVAERTRGSGCPFCSGRKISPENSIAGYHTFLTEWDSHNSASPEDVHVGGSSTKYWWLCTAGHRWKAKPATRKRGHGCPGCSPNTIRFVLPGLLLTIGLPKTLRSRSKVIGTARSQGFPEPMVEAVLDAIMLLRRGTFTEEDFERYIEGEGSTPLTKWFNGSEKHRRAIREGWIEPERG